jgi:hypothetical protein
LESNNNSQNDGSGDDSMDEQEEQSIVDMTESDASDGMLIDGLRTFVMCFELEEATVFCFLVLFFISSIL